MSAMKANGNRSLIRVVWPFVAIVGALLLLSIISLNVLSTIRAYVGGEGLWSKAQKDAIYYLSRYAGSRSEQDFHAYKVPLPSSWVTVRRVWRWTARCRIWTRHAPAAARRQSSR
jgi:hypothetical protein